MARRLRRDEYTVGWVCALPVELTAAQVMLDEEHQDLPPNRNDSNIYTLGRIGEHNVVLACLPAGQTGTNSAAAVAIQMQATFPAIRIGLMVGIGGGVPSKEADIRLGDVIVSQPGNGHGGVIQYDFGKSTPSGFQTAGFLNAPPYILLAAVAKLRSNQDRGRGSLSPHLSKLSKLPKFTHDKVGSDVLFKAEYNHVGEASCRSCSATERIQRDKRPDKTPVVHYGIIASGNQVMRHGKTRDQISSEFGGVLCFEMEAAGLTNSFPCLVIRGICDYADSHKNKTWQPYAAGTAAAYAKELLLVIPAADVMRGQTMDEATKEQPQTSSFFLPLQRNHRFVGRSVELDMLYQMLFVTKDCQKVALAGLGGIGKTQVALRFVHSIKQTHPEFSIFWVPALSMEAFEQACTGIADVLGISQLQGDIRKAVQQRLSSKDVGKWLLIIDNADDLNLLCGSEQEEGLLDFLPESDDGLTVFTTRHYEVAQSVTGGDIIEVGNMENKEAVDLLSKSLAQKDCLSNHAAIESLLTELDYLPLAISQAAAYINTNRSSVVEYLGFLKNTEREAIATLSREFYDNTRYKKSANAVAKTWTVTFNELFQRNKLAADLLAFISCIEWRAIPYSILPVANSEAELVDAIGTLCSYSFLQKRDGKMLDMHRLVHLATRTWVNQNQRETETRKAALKHLAKVFPSSDYSNRAIWQDYLPHVARMDMDEQHNPSEDRSRLCLKVGQCLYVDGRIKESVLWLTESCDWRDRNLPENHPDRLLSQYELAGSYLKAGQIKEAVDLLENIVAIHTGGAIDDNASQLAAQHELARAYNANGQIKKAIKLLETLVSKRVETLPVDHHNRLSSQHELAIVYTGDGQATEAIKLLEHVVAIREKVLTEDHPDRLGSQNALAGSYTTNGQIKQAIKLLEHVVAIRTKVFAEHHPNLLISQHELARAYHADGRVKDAMKLLEHVVAIQSNALAENHPNQLSSQHELARAYHAEGRVKDAVKLLEQVVSKQSEVLTENHPNRLVSQHELARAYHAEGRVKDAVKLLEQVVLIQSEVLGGHHPTQLISQHELARAYFADGQTNKAVKLLEKVVATREKLQAKDHPHRLQSEALLASFYSYMPQRPGTGQSSESSFLDAVAEDGGGRKSKPASLTSQEMRRNSQKFSTGPTQSSVGKESKSSSTSTRRRLPARLMSMLRKKQH